MYRTAACRFIQRKLEWHSIEESSLIHAITYTSDARWVVTKNEFWFPKLTHGFRSHSFECKLPEHSKSHVHSLSKIGVVTFLLETEFDAFESCSCRPCLGQVVVLIFREDFLSLMSIDVAQRQKQLLELVWELLVQHKQAEQHPAWHHAPIIRIHNLLLPIRCP